MNKQKGFSILEVFISLVVGIFLLGGVLSVFSSLKTTASQTSTYGHLQENGRLAISLLTDDLMRQGFWGELSGNLDFTSLELVPGVLGADCVGEGLNNRSFPLSIGHFRALWGQTAESKNLLDCISDAKVNSDVIQIKRVVSSSILPAAVEDDKYYLITNMSSGAIFKGDEPIPDLDYGNIWEYQHHIYYVKERTINGTNVPILAQGRLLNTSSVIWFDDIIDGIEMIRFSYGVDTDGDGVVNAFIPADNMPALYWDSGDILAVKIFVLVRDIYPDYNYENENSYQVGNIVVEGNKDNYHRLLMSSTVTLFNARTDTW
jgi:type IV pilus assembly protein PilW